MFVLIHHCHAARLTDKKRHSPAMLGVSRKRHLREQPALSTSTMIEMKALERFPAKWIPVRVKKTRQNKRLELRSDSIGTEKALDGLRHHHHITP
jgi:hypothetical protein